MRYWVSSLSCPCFCWLGLETVTDVERCWVFDWECGIYSNCATAVRRRRGRWSSWGRERDAKQAVHHGDRLSHLPRVDRALQHHAQCHSHPSKPRRAAQWPRSTSSSTRPCHRQWILKQYTLAHYRIAGEQNRPGLRATIVCAFLP